MAQLCARMMSLVAISWGLVVVGLASTAGTTSAHADDTVLRDIKVIGRTRVSPGGIKSHVTLTPGDQLDPAEIDATLKALYATGQFSHVDVYAQGSTLVIDVVDNPTLAAVTIKGNSEVKDDEIKSALNLDIGTPLTRTKTQRAVRAVEDLYKQKGRHQTKVASETSPDTNGTTTLTLTITEADIDKVSAITFVGNSQISTRVLRDVIRTTESSWFDVLRGNAVYKSDQVAADKELLRQHYRDAGFADVKVTSAEGVFDDETQGYRVTYTIDEGPRFRIQSIDIETQAQVTGLDKPALLQHIASKEGAPFSEKQVHKDQLALTRLLIKQDHLSTRVAVKEDRDVASETVSLVFIVTEGEARTIETIEIRGNTKTKDYVLRRALKLRAGKPYHPLLAEQSKIALKNLGYIKSANIATRPGSESGTTIVTVHVEEKDSRVLDYGVAYSDREGIIGDISIEERNLMGNGQWAKLKLIRSQERFEVGAGITEPNFLGSSIRTGADFAYKDHDRTDQSSHKSETITGKIRLGKSLTENIDAEAAYTLSRNKIYDIGANASQIIKNAANRDGTTNNTSATDYTSAISLAANYDTRDSAYIPTQGTLISLGQDFAGVGGDVRYIRTSADLRTYIPVSSQVTLAARAQAGVITGWGGQDVRLLDAFYKGNDLVRGFAYGGIGPRDLASPNQDALGGTAYWGMSLGANFDIPYVPKDLGVRGGVFADAGSLFRATNTAQASASTVGSNATTRASVGASLIWDSPIGALRADYAVPILAERFDQKQAFSFGVGQF